LVGVFQKPNTLLLWDRSFVFNDQKIAACGSSYAVIGRRVSKSEYLAAVGSFFCF